MTDSDFDTYRQILDSHHFQHNFASCRRSTSECRTQIFYIKLRRQRLLVSIDPRLDKSVVLMD